MKIVEDPVLDAVAESVEAVEWLQGVITCIRQLRTDRGVPSKKKTNILLKGGRDKDTVLVKEWMKHLKFMIPSDSISWAGDDSQDACDSISFNGLEILLPLDGIVDGKAESVRLRKTIASLEADINLCKSKLNNESFISKAPQDVVQKVRERLEECELGFRVAKGQLEGVGL